MAEQTTDPQADADTDASPISHQHRDPAGGWLRPTVFGMMDGLVSNFALIAGFSGGHASTNAIALAGWAGLVGGAFSMATGEFISVQSQNESTEAEIELERQELKHNADAELEELTAVYIARGVEPRLAGEVAAQISQDPEQALIVHTLTELGVDPHTLPSPLVAAGSSLGSFSIGAVIPLLPYVCGVKTLWISAILAVVALFVAGAITSKFTVRSWWYSGGRQLIFGGLAALVTFGVGEIFHAA